MQKIKILLSVFFLLLLIPQNSFSAASRNLTIFAEPNMALALTKIARLYSQHSNSIVSVNFNSSYDLMSDITAGEPADIFISAHSGWIESLRQKGLVDVYNIGYIASDSLALVALESNKNFPAELSDEKLPLEQALKILNQNRATLILDSETNASGDICGKAVKNLALHNLKIFRKISEDKSSFLSVVRNNVESYSLLLASQIKNETDFRILATKTDGNIFYQALVIAGDNMEVAREFIKFLKSDVAKAVFEESGFKPS